MQFRLISALKAKGNEIARQNMPAGKRPDAPILLISGGKFVEIVLEPDEVLDETPESMAEKVREFMLEVARHGE